MDDAHGRSPADPDDDFVTWLRARHRRLLATTVVIAGDVDVARGATEEAFARALERWPKVRGMTSRDAWVSRVALDALRRRGRRAAIARLLPADPRTSPVVPQLAVDVDVDLWRALQSLPLRARTALALHAVSDLSEAGAATAMGVRPESLAQLLHDARRALAALLRDDEPVPVELEEVRGDRPGR